MNDKVNVQLLADTFAKIFSKKFGVEITATVTPREEAAKNENKKN